MKIAVVGATGIVGRTLVSILGENPLPVKRLDVFASKKSCGIVIPFGEDGVVVETISSSRLKGYDVVFFCAGAEVSEKLAPTASKNCGLVIDNSAFFRRKENVPLIVPEINMEDGKSASRIISNPNCSTIQCALPLNALKRFGLRRVWFTTYQAVSGSGQKGISALKHALNGSSDNFYACDISKNTLPFIGEGMSDGYTEEEHKMMFEIKKILHLQGLAASATCVRVPVENGHGISVVAELENSFVLDKVVEAISGQDGVMVVDRGEDVIQQRICGENTVAVGRIRRDAALKNGVSFYCVADNLRRGAAYNAVGIARGLLCAGQCV